MKKVLSLVMSLALTLSLANAALAAPVATTTTKASTTASTTTTFTDESSITNTDAVSLLAKLGILSGYEDGSYQPAKAVTRAEAAKIVCYLLLGEDAASSLADAAVTTGFTDVDGQGYDWATGFIQYAASNGIISGYGDGTFGPGNTVTTYQLAKMILCGLGYGVNGEYTGTYWATNVAVQAVKLGILEKGAANEDCSRDITALTAYNSLFVYLVTWSSDDNKYSPVEDDDVKQTLAIQNYDYKTAMGVLKNDDDGDGYYIDVTNTEEVSEDVVYVDCTDSTLLGLNVEAGCIDDQGITAVTAIDKVLATKTNGYVSDWLDNDEDDYIDDLDSSGATIIYNGEEVATGLKTVATLTADGYLGNPGQVVKAIDQGVLDDDDDEEYSFDGDIDIFVVVDKYVSQIGDDGVTVDDDEVTIDGVAALDYEGNTQDVDGIDADDIVYPSDLEAGDVVLSYLDNASGIYYVEKATSVTGTISAISYKNGGYHYTIDSTKYGETGLNNGGIDDTNLNGDVANSISVDDEVTAYLDNNGDFVYVDTDATGTASYAAIVKAKLVSATSADDYVSVKLLFSDGTTEVVTVDQIDGDDGVDYGDETDIEALAGTIVSYDVNSDGTYDLNTADSSDVVEYTDSGDGTISDGVSKITIDGDYYYGDSSTVYFLNDDGDYYAYTGYKNAPDVTSEDCYAIVDGTAIDYIYVDGTVDGTSADSYYFLGNNEYTDNDDYYSYTVDMDGSASAELKTESKLSSDSDSAYDDDTADEGYVYAITSQTTDGYAKGIEKQVWSAGVDLVSGGTLVVGDDSYSYDSDTVVYKITYNVTKDKYESTISTVSSAVKVNENDLIYVATDDDSDDETPYATEIFVLKDAAPGLSVAFSSDTDSDTSAVTVASSYASSLAATNTTSFALSVTKAVSNTVTFTAPDDAESISVTADTATSGNTCDVDDDDDTVYTVNLASGTTQTFTVEVTAGNGLVTTYTVTLTATT